MKRFTVKSNKKIGILKLASGNIGSVQNIIDYCGGDSILIEKPADIIGIKKIIIPGVGHFDHAMKSLQERKQLLSELEQIFLLKDVKVLGICLGMQILANFSEEGEKNGLGWIKGRVVRIQSEDSRVPRMGWIKTTFDRGNSLFKGFDSFEEVKFYHVHSYHFIPDDEEVIISRTDDDLKIVTGIQQDNVTGLQFHPEKSHKYGIQLFKNFLTQV